MLLHRFLIRNFVERYLTEGKNSGVLALFDELYKEISKEKFKNDEARFESLKNQISIYMGGPKAPRGSSRMVFPLDADRVVKLALNEAGFAQNGMEATIGMDDSVLDIINPVLSHSNIVDYDGFFWIVSKKIIPLNDDITGKSWPEFSALLRKAVATNEKIFVDKPELRTTIRDDSQKTKVEIPKRAAEKNQTLKLAVSVENTLKNVDEDFFETFRKFTRKYKGAVTPDLLKPDSWGLDDGKLKLIDYGYTKRISQDFYVGGYAGGSAKAKESLIARRGERIKNISSTIADNVDTIENTKKIPPMISLLLLIRGIVVGLPLNIETFAVGNPLNPLTPTELAAAANVIRTNQGKVERIIDQVTNLQLKNKLYDELDDILLSTGSLDKRQVESLIKKFIKECLLS